MKSEAPALRAELLGPLRLAVDGVDVSPTRTKVRHLAIAIAAHAGSFVSNDQLIDLLWADRLPADPRAALLVVTSRLRSGLGEAGILIESQASGVRFNGSSDLLDFDRFSSALIADESGITTLESALALWRGRPFDELADRPLLQPLAQRLTETRWDCSMRLAELQFAAGRFGDSVDVAHRLHSESPDRERAAIVLAEALAGLGRRAEALDVIGVTRRRLRDGFGLDVAVELAAVEQRILTGGVDIVSSTGRVERSDADDVNFVGREGETDWLLSSNSAPRSIIGEPGAGKSALLAHVGDRYAESGATVWRVRVPEVPDQPMAAAAELVRLLIADFAVPAGDELLDATIHRLTGYGRVTEPQLLAVTRDGLVEAIARLVAHCARGRHAVLIVDDAQWLDTGSAELIELVAGLLPVVLAMRPDHLSHGARHLAALAELDAMTLPPLSRTAIAELAAVSLREADVERFTDRILDRSAGNALFARLIIDNIANGVDRDGSDLPVNVLVAVQQRLSVLSASARETMLMASAFGDRAPLGPLGELRESVVRDLDEAVAERLVTIDGDAVWFAHGLVADGAYALVGDGRRVEFHDAIGRVLEDRGHPALEYARHYERAAALDPERSASAMARAANEAAVGLDWELVAQLATAGIAMTSDGVTEAELAISLGRAQRALHRVGSAESLLNGARAARDAGDNELFGRVVVVLAALSWSLKGADPSVVRELYNEALELEVSTSVRAQLCAAAATLVVTGGHPRARELYHEAVSLALEFDDPNELADVLRYARWGLGHPDDFGLFCELAILLADTAGDSADLRWASASNRFTSGAIAGDRELVDDVVRDLRSSRSKGSSAQHDWELAHLEVAYSLLDGDPTIAEQWLTRVLELETSAADAQGEGVGHPDGEAEEIRPIYGVALLGVRRAQGRIGEMLPFVDMALANQRDVVSWHCVAAGIAVTIGDRARATAEVAEVTALGLDSLPQDFMWTATVKMFAEAVVFVEDRVLAVDLIDLLAPYSGRVSWAGVAGDGPIDDVLASLSRLCGDESAAMAYEAHASDLRHRLLRTESSPPLLSVS